MRIRRSTLEDSKELSKLRKSTIRAVNKHDYSPEQIRSWSKRGNAKQFRQMHSEMFRYVAVEKGKIVGFADFRKESPDTMGSLYVHKDFLRKGIGARLMEKIEKTAKEMGVRRFALKASITAKVFYEKLGYRVITLLPNRRKGDEFLMEKKL